MSKMFPRIDPSFISLTRLVEEAYEVDLVATALVLLKSDSADHSLVGEVCIEEGVMYSAEINEIESASAHNEKRLKEIARVILCRSKIADDSPLCAELELANARKHAVHFGRICEQIGLELNSAFAADVLLLGF